MQPDCYQYRGQCAEYKLHSCTREIAAHFTFTFNSLRINSSDLIPSCDRSDFKSQIRNGFRIPYSNRPLWPACTRVHLFRWPRRWRCHRAVFRFPRVIKWILHARHVDSPAVSPDMWVGCRMLFLTTIWSIVYARPLFSARVRFSNQITWRGFNAAPTYKITFCCRKIFIFHAVGMWYNIEITKVSIRATSLHTIQIIQNGSTLI